MNISYKTHPCSVGYVLAAVCNDGLFAVTLGKTKAQAIDSFYTEAMAPTDIVIGSGEGSQYDLVSLIAKAIDDPHTNSLTEVLRYNSLVMRGTNFQKKVWAAMRCIAPGVTMTYGELAKTIGHPKAARAVASACAANRLAFVIPCHRVIGNGGKLCGYRWGSNIKEQLLLKEKV